jgi:hypothetical protein
LDGSILISITLASGRLEEKLRPVDDRYTQQQDLQMLILRLCGRCLQFHLRSRNLLADDDYTVFHYTCRHPTMRMDAVQVCTGSTVRGPFQLPILASKPRRERLQCVTFNVATHRAPGRKQRVAKLCFFLWIGRFIWHLNTRHPKPMQTSRHVKIQSDKEAPCTSLEKSRFVHVLKKQ